MANSEESNPLLPNQEQESVFKNEKKSPAVPTGKSIGAPPPPAIPAGWTAAGLPVGEPMMDRSQWDSGIFSCLGRHDGFCSSDLEVCLLGTVAPCVLYGSNVERLGSAPGTFANHCLPYTGLYLMGNTFFGWNCLAPWFSYPIRTAIRRKFNLEGSCEAVARSCGCCGSFVEDDAQREQCETTCDFAPMYSATRAPFVRRGVKFVVGFRIPASTRNLSLSWLHQGDRPWIETITSVSRSLYV